VGVALGCAREIVGECGYNIACGWVGGCEGGCGREGGCCVAQAVPDRASRGGRGAGSAFGGCAAGGAERGVVVAHNEFYKPVAVRQRGCVGKHGDGDLVQSVEGDPDAAGAVQHKFADSPRFAFVAVWPRRQFGVDAVQQQLRHVGPVRGARSPAGAAASDCPSGANYVSGARAGRKIAVAAGNAPRATAASWRVRV
jgi:hypothetical protein